MRSITSRRCWLRRLGLRGWPLLLSVTVTIACAPKSDPGVVQLSGRIEAVSVDLAPKVAGRVVEVRVREGDRVKAGDLLIRLDLGDVGLAPARDREGVRAAEARLDDLAAGSRRAEIAAAEADVAEKTAALTLAQAEVERQQSLLASAVGSEQASDRAQADRDRAAAALAASRKRLELTREGFRKNQTAAARAERDRAARVLEQSERVAAEAEIRAPADGVVLHRIAEPGLLLAPGQSGLTLAFADRLYVRTFIPETQLGRVRVGMAATVSVDAHPGQSFPAKVAEISPQAEFTPKPVETKSERVNLVYAAEVDLDAGWNAPLVPGQPASVTISIAQP